MPELRKDPIIGRWIIISTERGKRPTDFIVEKNEGRGGFCPLCPGNENTTPPEVLSYSSIDGHQNNKPGWDLRVVPNKYPALVIEGNLNKEGNGLYDRMNGIGAHEVIIETPDHNESFTRLPPERMIKVFLAYRDRLLDLAQDPRFRYVMVFKNFGAAAGASLEHSHSQLIALPILPRMISSELEGSLSYYKYKERCIFCDLIDFELREGVRVVKEFSNFVTMAPYASSSPFELRLFPKRHSHDFALMNDAQLAELAVAMKDMLLRVKTVLRDAPYNFILHTAPPMHRRPGKPTHWNSLELDYHWHIELVPRLTQVAGFEWGTGFYINPTSPEDAAQFLREADV